MIMETVEQIHALHKFLLIDWLNIFISSFLTK